MMNSVNEIVNLQFNKSIISKFKETGMSADTLGSACLVLYALKENKLNLLDELDDNSTAKRMFHLYQNLHRKGLIEEGEKNDKSLYKITDKGKTFVDNINKEVNDEVEPQLAISTEQKAEMRPQIDNAWMMMYVNLFPKHKQCHSRILPERFQKFEKMFPEYYDSALILKATKAYIKNASETENGLDYIRQAHYFIWKTENGGTTYDLATWCEKMVNQKESKSNDYDVEFMNSI